jgi:hypothetical protein
MSAPLKRERIISGKSKEISSRGTSVFLSSLINEVEKDAKDKSYPKGAYVLVCSELFDNYDTLRGKQELIKRKIAEYIQNTQALDKAPDEIIIQEGVHYVTIGKAHNGSNEIREMEIGVLFGSGIGTELCKLVEKAIIEKREAFKNKEKRSGVTYANKVLLLYNEYGFRSEGFDNPDVLKSCLSRLASLLKDFHTIFWIEDPVNEQGFILFSESRDLKI